MVNLRGIFILNIVQNKMFFFFLLKIKYMHQHDHSNVFDLSLFGDI